MIILPALNYEEVGFRSNVVDELVESVVQSLNARPDVVGLIFNCLPTAESTLLQILNGDNELYHILRLRGGEMISQDFVDELDKIVGNIDHLLVGRKKQILDRLSTEPSLPSQSRFARLAT